MRLPVLFKPRTLDDSDIKYYTKEDPNLVSISRKLGSVIRTFSLDFNAL